MGRFIRRGKSKFRFAPTIAVKAVPTRAEIASSTALTTDISDVGGFSISADLADAPDLDSKFTKKVAGVDGIADSSLTFHDDDTTTAIRTAVAKGTPGFILYFPYGDVPTKRMEVWPVESTGVNDQITAANETGKYVVTFAVTDTPAQGAVVPT
ncbi:MAG: hypothetical protein ACR2M4_06405 [Actinomycetota bacterium]